MRLIDPDLQIIECAGGQIEQAESFCTIGLSKTCLPSPVSEKIIRHELMVIAPEGFGPQNIPSILDQLAAEAVTRNIPYLRGDVVERSNPIFENRPFFGLYASIPAILPEQFATYRTEEGEDIVLIWMVPITKSEALFIRQKGWRQFEVLAESQKADLVDFDRSSLTQNTVHN